jgi:signal transduction histidine kinase
MNRIRRLTIKTKLNAIVMIVCGSALLLATAVFAIFDFLDVRFTSLRQLRGIGEIIALNSSAPLTFSDRRGAKETLDSLQADARIDNAAIYTKTGELFAFYQRRGNTIIPVPLKPQADGSYFEEDNVILFQPIHHKNERMGTLFIRANLHDLIEHLKLYSAIAALALFGALGLAYILSSKLQKSVSDPILNLTQIAQQVSEEKNYSLRAQKSTEDELGRLVEQFNEMLDHIQNRDAALQHARDELEDRVRDRTLELEQEIGIRRTAEEKLHYHATELERSNKELENFAFIASHDLQEPLRKVVAFMDRIKDQIESHLDDKGLDFMKRILSATARMQQLIDDLLKLSRVTTKGNPPEPVDINPVLQDVLDDIEIRLKTSEGSVYADVLPQVLGDRNQLRQLFQNLIVNALKFRREDTPPVVHIRAQRLNEKFWEFCVEDNGIGFEEKYAERIFKPFERLQGRSTVEGTGIGLAICQKIITRHSGAIHVKSQPGHGSRFYFTLPAVSTGVGPAPSQRFAGDGG